MSWLEGRGNTEVLRQDPTWGIPEEEQGVWGGHQPQGGGGGRAPGDVGP